MRIGVDGGQVRWLLADRGGYFGGPGQDDLGRRGRKRGLTYIEAIFRNLEHRQRLDHHVGNSGAGTLTMSGGSGLNVAGGQIVLGAGATGTAQVNLSGSANINATTGEIWVGNDRSNTTVDISGSSSDYRAE